MKHIKTILSGAVMLALAIPAGAQQIANSDFDGEWRRLHTFHILR